MACDSESATAVRDTFRLLAKAHMLDILHEFVNHEGPLRFNDLQGALGLSPNTLSARLKDLTEAGFITRTSYNTIPPRVDYETTAKTDGLCTVFEALHNWVDKTRLVEAS